MQLSEMDMSSFKVVHLKSAHLLLPETWPRFTLLGQGWGSLVLAYEALQQFVPEVGFGEQFEPSLKGVGVSCKGFPFALVAIVDQSLESNICSTAASKTSQIPQNQTTLSKIRR